MYLSETNPLVYKGIRSKKTQIFLMFYPFFSQFFSCYFPGATKQSAENMSQTRAAMVFPMSLQATAEEGRLGIFLTGHEFLLPLQNDDYICLVPV